MIPKKILFCTDFSKYSEAAKQCALEQARAFGSDVIIVHVIGSWPVHAYRGKVPIREQETVHTIQEPVNIDLELVALEFKELVKDVQSHTLIGSPAQEIVKLAEEENVDLIIIGSHGWSGFRYRLLGSVAENILRIASCSVMVVKPPKDRRKSSD